MPGLGALFRKEFKQISPVLQSLNMPAEGRFLMSFFYKGKNINDAVVMIPI